MADINAINSAPGSGAPAQGATGVASLVSSPTPQVKVTDGVRPQSPPPPPPPPAPKKPSSSPWDEDAPEPAAKAPAIIGTLHDQEPLEFPKNVEEKVGQKIPASEFVGKEAVAQNENTDDWDWFNTGGQTKSQTLSAPNPQRINLGAAAVAPQAAPPIPVQNQPSPAPVAAAPVVPAPAAVPTPPAPVTAPNPSQPKSSFLTGLFGRKKNESPPVPSQAQALPAVANSDGGRLKKIALGFMGAIILFSLLTLMTEMGIVSLGLERVYGAVGIENLWKGLTPDAEQSLAYSFVATKSHANYKVKGTMKLRIDSSVKSEVVSPLISMAAQSQYSLRDRSVGQGISATKAVSDSYNTMDSVTSIDSSTDSTSSSDSATSSASSTTSNTANSGTTAAVSQDTSAVSSETSSASTPTSTVTDLEANVSLKATSSGTQAKIAFKKDGVDEEVNLVNVGPNLYVKGTPDISFGGAAPSEFVKYQIGSLEDKSISQDIFDIKTNSGLSIKGKRTGNEIAGGVRCYKYQIDSVELGNALSGIGITSDYVQTATGQIWIGIRDKTIRRAQLKITTPISSAVTMIDLDVQFYDYDVTNKLDFQNEIANAVAPMAATSSALSGDAKRKADVDAILEALAKYKAAVGSYPVSSELLKLNASGNIIETALVPKYLPVLPVDPMTGWYYAYKSANGQQCSLSSRLEDSSDASGQLINGTYLYLKYSN